MADISTVKLWFDNLKAIRNQMLTLNHDTKSNLKEFSKQLQKEVLISDQIKGNLDQFCNITLNLSVTSSSLNGEKNFRFFLDKISFSIETSLRILLRQAAIEHDPSLANQVPSQVMALKLNEVFGIQPLNSNPAKQIFNQVLISANPKEFYDNSGTLLSDGEKTLSGIVKSIIN